MHDPRCMIRASILSISGRMERCGACATRAQNGRPSRKRLKKEGEEQLREDDGSQGMASGHNNHSLYILLII